MDKTFKPLLATQLDDLTAIKYPVYASFKLDGIRAVIFNGVALSRSLKPIPNKQIQQWASDNALSLEGVDGEFIVGSPTSETVFRDTTSFVMSHDKVQEFSFYAFDVVNTEPFVDRLNSLKRKVLPDNTIVLKQHLITSSVDLEAFRTDVVAMGYEGVMIRLPGGKYKYGRSSVKEQILLKMKLFEDIELKVVGFEPLYKNTNEATINELGRSQRSSVKENLVPQELLGALTLLQPNGVTVSCGSGFDQKERIFWWKHRNELIGKLVTVKYFNVGIKDVLRFPIFKGFRDEKDIS